MACINRSHPEFKTLAAKSDLNESVLAANIAIWMEQNNTTLFPTMEELEVINKPEEKYFSYSPIKQLGFKYNTNTAGFMPSNVPLFQVKKDAERLGLSVHKAKSGNWYFKNQRGQFINPHKYQVEGSESRLPEVELNIKLKEWAKKHDIKVEAIEEMITRLGPDSRYDGVVAVADLLNKIITINPNKEKIDTLAEEISHFATAILKDDISVKKALEKITDTEIYKKVKEDYKDLYIKEEDFKKEAMDKLLAQSIIENFQTEEDTKGIIPYIKAIFNKFWKWVNKNLKRTNAETDIKNELYPLAKRVLAGDYLGTVDSDESVVSSQTDYYQTEESEETPEESKDEKTEKEIAIDFLNNNIEKLSKRLAHLENFPEKEKQAQVLQDEISRIREAITEDELRAGILGVIDSARGELDQIKKVHEEHKEKGILNGSVYKYVDDFVSGYIDIFSRFKDDMIYYDFNPKLQQQMIEAMQGLQSDFSEIQSNNNILASKASIKALKEANTNASGEKIDPNFNEIKAVREVGSDISPWRLQVGNWKQASSSILRNAWKIVQESNLKVKRKAVVTAEALLEAQVQMEKAGYKVSDLVDWTYDSKGKKESPTQFLIRQADWAGYNKNREIHRKSLLKKYNYQNWFEFKKDIKEKKFSKQDLESISKEEKAFKKNNPMKAVYNEFGEVEFYEPSARNPRYKELMKNTAVRNYYNLLLQTKEEAINKLPKKYRTEYFKYMLPGIRGQFVEKLYRPDVPFSDNIKQVFHESVFRDQDDTEFGESKELGNQMVPIFFNRRFDNIKELSTDLTRTFTLYAEMAENFQQKNKIAGDIWTLKKKVGEKNYVSSIRKQNIEGTASNEYKALNILLDHHIYGIQDLDYKVKIPDNKVTQALKINNKEFSISKVVKRFTSYIKTNNLALSPFTSTAGHLKGTVDTILEDQIGRYSTVESKNWARQEYFKNVPEVLGESVKKKQSNLMHLLMRRNNVIDINSLLRNTERKKLTSNLANSEHLYVNYKLADYPIKGRIMLSVYDNHRLVDGKFIDKETFIKRKRAKNVSEKEINKEWKSFKDKTYYNAFEVVDNQVQVKKEYQEFVDEKLENKITGIIEHVSNNVDGVMSQEDKGALSRQIMGEFLLMHRGWFINMIDSRFMSRNVNPLTEKEDMGYWTAVFEFIKKDMFSDGIANSYKALSANAWRKMRKEDPAKAKGLKRAFLDLIYLNVVGLLAGLVNAAADDGDDEDYLLQYAAFQMNRVLLEQASGNPILNPGEILQIMEKPVVGVNTIKELTDLTEAFNFGETYERGMYADKSHAQKWWIRRTPFRSLYEAQYPKMKNQFMKTVLDSQIYDLLKDEDESIGFYKKFKAILTQDVNSTPQQAMDKALDIE